MRIAGTAARSSDQGKATDDKTAPDAGRVADVQAEAEGG